MSRKNSRFTSACVFKLDVTFREPTKGNALAFWDFDFQPNPVIEVDMTDPERKQLKSLCGSVAEVFCAVMSRQAGVGLPGEIIGEWTTWE